MILDLKGYQMLFLKFKKLEFKKILSNECPISNRWQQFKRPIKNILLKSLLYSIAIYFIQIHTFLLWSDGDHEQILSELKFKWLRLIVYSCEPKHENNNIDYLCL